MTTLGGTVTHFFGWHFNTGYLERGLFVTDNIKLLFDCHMVKEPTCLAKTKKRVLGGNLPLFYKRSPVFDSSFEAAP